MLWHWFESLMTSAVSCVWDILQANVYFCVVLLEWYSIFGVDFLYFAIMLQFKLFFVFL